MDAAPDDHRPELDALLRAGAAARRQGDRRGALTFFAAALEAAPRDPRPSAALLGELKALGLCPSPARLVLADLTSRPLAGGEG